MPAAYRIADEPRPGALEHLAVGPIWPLFAVMFAGPWLAWPWFVLNAFAIGSPTRFRELLFALLAALGAVGLVLLIGYVDYEGLVSRRALAYTGIILTVYKLGVSYWLFVVQSRTFGIYEYFGGVARNGIIVIVAAFIFGERLFQVVRTASPILARAFWNVLWP